MNPNTMRFRRMASITVLCFLLVTILFSTGCSMTQFAKGKRIRPSDVVITETREVSSFSGIDLATLGNLVLSQGSSEAVTVSGSDNLVALITTEVRDGILSIGTSEEINYLSIDEDQWPTYTVVVKDLSSMTISEIGDVQMGALATPKLTVDMSGGGKINVSQLTTDELKVVLSGGGVVELAGEAKQATIELSGAGSVNLPDLKIQNANVTIPGVGGATLWVTDRLEGEISSIGGVDYYGNPETDVKTTGLGGFKALGAK